MKWLGRPRPRCPCPASPNQVYDGVVNGALAWGNFTNAVNITGTGELHVGRADEATPGSTLAAFAAGFVEGVLTAELMCDMSYNLETTFFQGAVGPGRGERAPCAPCVWVWVWVWVRVREPVYVCACACVWVRVCAVCVRVCGCVPARTQAKLRACTCTRSAPVG
jgi:hypothetical protein